MLKILSGLIGLGILIMYISSLVFTYLMPVHWTIRAFIISILTIIGFVIVSETLKVEISKEKFKNGPHTIN
jgi:predicted CDP-diglyceride synthetase/phosphatidate cytidylyltransferase